MTVNIGLVGTGRIGRLHAENLAFRLRKANLLAVSDIDRASAEQTARSFHIPHVADTFQQILENDDIHAVAICSSTNTHAQFIIDAAQSGKHIFCEKPIALDLATIDAALDAVEQAGVKLMVGFNRRFHPNFKRIKQIVASGQIGQPHLVCISSRDPEPPPVEYVKVSGGIFLDMMIHDFDMARFLIDGEVTEIFATGDVLIDPEIGKAGDVDTAVAVLRFENGAICTIDNSRKSAYGYDQRVEVFGSGGMAAAPNSAPNNVQHFTGDGIHASKPYYFFLDLYHEAYVEELKTFVDVVEQNTEPPITGMDGRIPLVMGLAATKSLHEGRPVKLSEIT